MQICLYWVIVLVPTLTALKHLMPVSSLWPTGPFVLYIIDLKSALLDNLCLMTELRSKLKMRITTQQILVRKYLVSPIFRTDKLFFFRECHLTQTFPEEERYFLTIIFCVVKFTYFINW